MAKDYEGKIGLAQLFLCLLAAATLAIPLAFEPELDFAFNHVMPIAESDINAIQITFIQAFLETLNLTSLVPESVFEIIPYVIYAFYAVLAFDIFFTLVMMILRNEIMRIILRAISVLLGFVMLAVFLVSLVSVAGFFTYYLNDGFGDGALIFDCIKNSGFLFFLGVTLFSIITAIKQFSSFFGMTC